MPSATVDRVLGVASMAALKAPVRVATTAAITLSGLQTIDSVALAEGDRVLVKNQVDTIENGIYKAAALAWTRAQDFDDPRDVVLGTKVLVTNGTLWANTEFRVSAANPISPGVSAITWTEISSESSGSAATSAAAAAASASAAAVSAVSADQSADDAATSATAASASAAAASSSASTASTHATNAGNSATAAAGSATMAGTEASNAASSASAASGSASTAAAQAANAADSASAALDSVADAASSAVLAALAASSLQGTSTSSVTIGTGSKGFTTQAGKNFATGRHLLVTSDANPTTHLMAGRVTAYSGTSLTVDVEVTAGSGSRSDWTIRVDGERGQEGPQGDPGSGSGDVTTSGSVVAGDLAEFADTTGDLIRKATAANAHTALGLKAPTSTGTGAAYVVTTGVFTALFDGMRLAFKAHAASSQAGPTLNLDGLGAKVIRKVQNSGGDENAEIVDIFQGQECDLIYDAAANSAAGGWILLNPRLLPTGSVTNARLATMVQATIKGRASGAGTGAPADLSSGQVSTILGLGTLATLATVGTSQIDNDAVTAAKLANMTDGTVLGRAIGAGTGDPANLAISTLGTGKQSIWIPATAMTARTTNGAASGTVQTTTNLVMLKSLDFDATTQEFAQFNFLAPKGWNEGTVTFKAVWSHAATTVNFGVAWSLAGQAFSDDDALDTAFGTAIVVTDTGGTTNDAYLTAESAAVTIGSSPAEGDWLVFQVARVPADGGDTMAIDARLHGVMLLYTTNANTDD